MSIRRIHALVPALAIGVLVAAPGLALADHKDGHDPQGRSHAQEQDAGGQGGGSSDRGNAQSEPDANGKGPERDEGGRDVPDGNNGCGNDADRDDDNEGWCGGKPHPHAGDPDGDPESDRPDEDTPDGEVEDEPEAPPAAETPDAQDEPLLAPSAGSPDPSPVVGEGAQDVADPVTPVAFTPIPTAGLPRTDTTTVTDPLPPVSGTPVQVLGVRVDRPTSPAGDLEIVAAPATVGALPRTGTDLASLVAVASIALGVGGAALRRR